MWTAPDLKTMSRIIKSVIWDCPPPTPPLVLYIYIYS